MSTKERVDLIHYYQKAVVATTLHYPDEVREPSHFGQLKDLPEGGEEELALMTKIVDKMMMDLDFRYTMTATRKGSRPCYIQDEGEVAQVKEEKPKRPAA